MPDDARGRLSELKKLGLGSFAYLIPSFLTSGLSFFLTPLYTRYMSPADYGIVGFGTTLPPILALLLGWSVHSANYRLHHTMPTEEERKRLNGTILAFLLGAPLAGALVIEAVCGSGMVQPFRSFPYDPYLRLVVGASVLALFPGAAINALMVHEQHRRASTLNAVMVLSTASLTVLLVVILKKGAYGQLLALFLANGIVAVFSIVVLWGFGKPIVDLPILKEVLVFSIPLIPNELSKWVLSASDRVILERYVSTAELGRYALGYTFGSAVGVVLSAMSSALFPIVSRKLAEKDPNNDVPYLGSVVLFVSAGACLVAAALFPPFIRIVTKPAYHEATEIIPWVAFGFFFQCLYAVLVQGAFFAKRSGIVALVTVAGAASNVVLNLIFVPRYGIIAAAVNTLVGYAVVAALHVAIARRMYPIEWEHGRTVRIALAMGATFALALYPRGISAPVTLIVRGLILLIAFPSLSFVFGAVRRSEIARFRSVWQARRGSANARAR